MKPMMPFYRPLLPLTCAASLLLAVGAGHAATTAAKPAAAPLKPAYEQQYEASKKTASDRYTADKKICDEEKTASIRMQCRRDANDEYQQALASAQKTRDEAKKAAAAAAAAKPAAATTSAPAAAPAAVCNECGKVTAVQISENKGKGGPIGLIAGGVAGAVLGHQVGKGHGKDLATIAGAAGGAYAGHKIEEKMTSNQVWSVNVRFENGDERSYTYESDPKFVVGDKVKRIDNTITRY
ncbi:MAG: glycine zipper 2TM domain-containing protein [Sterolibacterium sp.]|nr:glycine zipper 2TM domain-containing protein [Sterolibacterium sp.]